LNKLERNRLKVAIAEAGLDKDVAQASRIAFEQNDNSALKALEATFGPRVYKLAKDMNAARYKRLERVSGRIGSYISLGICQFLTLTFRDDVFERTSQETRRRYVARFLRKNCGAYVANIDFGNDGAIKTYIDPCGEFHKSTAREHYHAIVFGNKIAYKEWHKYGAIKAEKVADTSDDVEATSKYVAKLSYHAMKMDLGKAPRLIYSREKEQIKKLFEDLF